MEALNIHLQKNSRSCRRECFRSIGFYDERFFAGELPQPSLFIGQSDSRQEDSVFFIKTAYKANWNILDTSNKIMNEYRQTVIVLYKQVCHSL